MAKRQFARECTACKKGMNEGYCFDGGRAYYCSEVLEAFKHHIARMGLDPDKFFYDQWRITCVAEEWVHNEEAQS